jgi:hypothetical protein
MTLAAAAAATPGQGSKSCRRRRRRQRSPRLIGVRAGRRLSVQNGTKVRRYARYLIKIGTWKKLDSLHWTNMEIVTPEQELEKLKVGLEERETKNVAV